MLLDQKLTWYSQINRILLRAEKSLNIFRASKRGAWGANPAVALRFYKAYIRSFPDFVYIFYGTASETRLLRIILGALHPTPTNALQIEANEPLLSIRRQILTQKLILKQEELRNQLILNNIQLS